MSEASAQRELRDIRDFLQPVSATDNWLTPPEILTALGAFDLDPCAPARWPAEDWPHAAQCIARPDDGLSAPWAGRVWLNPPYSDTSRWVARLAGHGTGTALIFARTETSWFTEHVWGRATALLFLAGRIRFIRVGGKLDNAPAPSVLVAYGSEDGCQLSDCGLAGYFVERWWRSGQADPGDQGSLFGGAA